MTDELALELQAEGIPREEKKENKMEGVTKFLEGKKQTCWNVTFNNPPDGWEEARAEVGCKGPVNGIIWVRQKAPSTGTIHLQGFIQFKMAVAKATAKKWWGSNMAWAQTMFGKVIHNLNYIKLDAKKTNIGPIYEFGEFRLDDPPTKETIPIKEQLMLAMQESKLADTNQMSLLWKYPDVFAKKGCREMLMMIMADRDKYKPIEILAEPQPWMTDIKSCPTATLLYSYLMVDDFAYRKIIWLWSHQGQRGKSTYLNWFYNKVVEQKREAHFMETSAYREMAHLLRTGAECIFVNVAREAVPPYRFLEGCRDGRILSEKYITEQKYLKKPKLVVAANVPPDPDRISCDKIVVINLDVEE